MSLPEEIEWTIEIYPCSNMPLEWGMQGYSFDDWAARALFSWNDEEYWVQVHGQTYTKVVRGVKRAAKAFHRERSGVDPGMFVTVLHFTTRVK